MLQQPQQQKQQVLYCPYHRDKLISSICLDNECHEKLLCKTCIEQNPSHNIIVYQEFCKQLNDIVNYPENLQLFEPQTLQIIEGFSLKDKLHLFQNHLIQEKTALQDQHIKILDSLMEEFIKNVTDMLRTLKNHIKLNYTRKVDEVMSQGTLKDKNFKIRAAKFVLTSLKKDNFSELNINLIKLHEGKLELTYSMQKVQQIFQEFRQKLQLFIGDTQSNMQKSLELFTKIFTEYEKRQSTRLSTLFGRLAQQQQWLPSPKTREVESFSKIQSQLQTSRNSSQRNIMSPNQNYYLNSPEYNSSQSPRNLRQVQQGEFGADIDESMEPASCFSLFSMNPFRSKTKNIVIPPEFTQQNPKFRHHHKEKSEDAGRASGGGGEQSGNIQGTRLQGINHAFQTPNNKNKLLFNFSQESITQASASQTGTGKKNLSLQLFQVQSTTTVNQQIQKELSSSPLLQNKSFAQRLKRLQSSNNLQQEPQLQKPYLQTQESDTQAQKTNAAQQSIKTDENQTKLPPNDRLSSLIKKNKAYFAEESKKKTQINRLVSSQPLDFQVSHVLLISEDLIIISSFSGIISVWSLELEEVIFYQQQPEGVGTSTGGSSNHNNGNDEIIKETKVFKHHYSFQAHQQVKYLVPSNTNTYFFSIGLTTDSSDKKQAKNLSHIKIWLNQMNRQVIEIVEIIGLCKKNTIPRFICLRDDIVAQSNRFVVATLSEEDHRLKIWQIVQNNPKFSQKLINDTSQVSLLCKFDLSEKMHPDASFITFNIWREHNLLVVTQQEALIVYIGQDYNGGEIKKISLKLHEKDCITAGNISVVGCGGVCETDISKKQNIILTSRSGCLYEFNEKLVQTNMIDIVKHVKTLIDSSKVDLSESDSYKLVQCFAEKRQNQHLIILDKKGKEFPYMFRSVDESQKIWEDKYIIGGKITFFEDMGDGNYLLVINSNELRIIKRSAEI